MDVKRWLKNEKDSEDFLSRKLIAMGEISLFTDSQKVRFLRKNHYSRSEVISLEGFVHGTSYIVTNNFFIRKLKTF